MEINKYIDHTYLKPIATSKEIEELCAEAKKYHFKTVCIPSSWIEFAKNELKGSNVGICTVIGFPLGYNSTPSKMAEAKAAIDLGADEVDMVMNIGYFKDDLRDKVLDEIKEIKSIVGDRVLKVIVETALLTNKEILEATKLISKSGADFIKTSTGFSTRGASLEDVMIMSDNAENGLKIKASGGIKTLEDAEKMIKFGADRLGTSSGVEIIKGTKSNKDY